MRTRDSGNAPEPLMPNPISLAQAAKISGLSQGHLNFLVRTGKMWGLKIGRNWITSETTVREYISIDHRPGPKHNQPSFSRTFNANKNSQYDFLDKLSEVS